MTNVAAEWLHQLAIVLLAEIEDLKAKQYDPRDMVNRGEKDGAVLEMYMNNTVLRMEVEQRIDHYKCSISLQVRDP